MREVDGRRVHSRVRGPQAVLRGLRLLLKAVRRLVIRNSRSMIVRATSDEELTWSRRLHDLLIRWAEEGDRLIAEGDAVLPPAPPSKKVRKS
jgi:hypothetical protein